MLIGVGIVDIGLLSDPKHLNRYAPSTRWSAVGLCYRNEPESCKAPLQSVGWTGTYGYILGLYRIMGV